MASSDDCGVIMAAEQVAGICGDMCPLWELTDIRDGELAREARAWVFSPPNAETQPRVGLVENDLASRCLHNFNIGACMQERPAISR